MGEGKRDAVVDDINVRLARRYSTALVLFHHAVGDVMKLGPTDHKCLDILLERGVMTGSELAAATGLTTGAITGVVARLERNGFIRRRPDPDDGRKQFLEPVMERVDDIDSLLGPFRSDLRNVLEGFDPKQLAAISTFLEHGATIALRHAALLRAQTSSNVLTKKSEGEYQ